MTGWLFSFNATQVRSVFRLRSLRHSSSTVSWICICWFETGKGARERRGEQTSRRCRERLHLPMVQLFIFLIQLSSHKHTHTAYNRLCHNRTGCEMVTNKPTQNLAKYICLHGRMNHTKESSGQIDSKRPFLPSI